MNTISKFTAETIVRAFNAHKPIRIQDDRLRIEMWNFPTNSCIDISYNGFMSVNLTNVTSICICDNRLTIENSDGIIEIKVDE